MPKKSKQTGGRKKRRRQPVDQMGGNIFHDIGNGIASAAKATYKHVLKPTYTHVLRPAHDYVKDKKLISRVLSVVPNPKAQIGAKVADQLGYGRKRARQMGAGASLSSGSTHMSTPFGASMTGSVSPAAVRF